MRVSIKDSKGDFKPHPETDGLVRGVIVDVTPLNLTLVQEGLLETAIRNVMGRLDHPKLVYIR